MKKIVKIILALLIVGAFSTNLKAQIDPVSNFFIEKYVDYKVKKDLIEKNKKISPQDKLVNAIQEGNKEKIIQAIKEGSNINARLELFKGVYVIRPFFFAIDNGYEYVPGPNKESHLIKKRKENIDISILKLFAEGFWIEKDNGEKEFIKAKLEQGIRWNGSEIDAVSWAISSDNIEAISYLNSLEGVSVTERDSEGVPKIFHVENLETLKYLVEKDNIDLRHLNLTTKEGLYFPNYLATQLNPSTFFTKEEKIIVDISNYLFELGLYFDYNHAINIYSKYEELRNQELERYEEEIRQDSTKMQNKVLEEMNK